MAAVAAFAVGVLSDCTSKSIRRADFCLQRVYLLNGIASEWKKVFSKGVKPVFLNLSDFKLCELKFPNTPASHMS